MAYVDGFLIPVPEANKEAYRKLAEMAAPIFVEHGALHVVECWGDDLMKGEHTDFYKSVKAEEGENVVFSWIVWPSREARDAGNKAAMEDSRFEGMMAKDIFDGKRMIYSGFQIMVDHKG